MSQKRSSNYIDLTQSSDAENNPPPSKKQARNTVNQPQNHTTSQSYPTQRYNPNSLHSQSYESRPNGSQSYASSSLAHGSQPRSSQSLGSRDTWSNTQATQQDDENEIIDLSQDFGDYGWVCLGAINAKIVGVRYVRAFYFSILVALVVCRL